MSFKARPVYFLIRDIDGRGGTEKFARSLALSLARQGQPIKIITTRHSLKRESRYLNEKGTVRVVRFFVPSWRVLGTFWYFLVLLVYLLRKKNEYELLQVFFLEYTALAAVLAGTLLKKKVLCRLACGGLYSDLLSLLKKPGGRFWLAVVKKKSFFVVMSHSMVQELINYGFLRERVYLIPNGVETDIFQPGRHPGSPEKKIIFVGRLTQQKGLEYLLRAMALMEEKNVSLILVGEGEKKEELRHLVLQLHLGDRVFFAGYQSQSLSYLQEADVFVLPSLAEGLSNALLEAMACGLPVVATKVSGTVDVIEEGVNGFLVEPGNPEALAEAMAGILKDEGLAYRMGQANRKKILEKYSLDKIVDEYLSLYKRLMAE